MAVSDHLTFFEEPDGLRRPLVIMAFSGWNDAAESATTAARYLSQLWASRPIASIDPEEFYHFGLSRPYVRFKPECATEREIIWPATEFSLAQPAELERDLIVGVAIEPHLKWRTYCACVLELTRRVGASLVLTLGALLGEVPHTRPVRLSGSAYDPELAARLGVRSTRYKGPRASSACSTRPAATKASRRRASGPTSLTTSPASRTRKPPSPSSAVSSACSIPRRTSPI